MIILDNLEQGTQEWLDARKGRPTASNASKFITSTGKPSAQATGYAYDIVAERRGFTAPPMEQTEWMLRGIELEASAREQFMEDKGEMVIEVGMCLTTDETASCSPDGLLVGEECGLEIKCPKPGTHYQYLHKGALPTAYVPQVHMSMAVTGYRRWWFMSHLPGERPLYVLVEWDDYTDLLLDHLQKFIKKIDKIEGELS